MMALAAAQFSTPCPGLPLLTLVLVAAQGPLLLGATPAQQPCSDTSLGQPQQG